mgnify:FL=1
MDVDDDHKKVRRIKLVNYFNYPHQCIAYVKLHVDGFLSVLIN